MKTDSMLPSFRLIHQKSSFSLGIGLFAVGKISCDGFPVHKRGKKKYSFHLPKLSRRII